MSAISNYSSLTKSSKRFLWVGYLFYLVCMNLLGGFDLIIERLVPSGNPILQILAMLLLYWLVIFLYLWAIDN
jgi:hypothetical protein